MELLFLLLLGAVAVLFVQLSSVKVRLERLEQRLGHPAPVRAGARNLELEQAPAEPAPVAPPVAAVTFEWQPARGPRGAGRAPRDARRPVRAVRGGAAADLDRRRRLVRRRDPPDPLFDRGRAGDAGGADDRRGRVRPRCWSAAPNMRAPGGSRTSRASPRFWPAPGSRSSTRPLMAATSFMVCSTAGPPRRRWWRSARRRWRCRCATARRPR